MKRLLIAGLLLLSSGAFALSPSSSAPAFNLDVLQNYKASPKLALKDLQGKVVYIDFWASWCGPCRQSLPILNELRNKYKDQGFEVVAINLDEDTKDATKFLKKYSVDYPIVADPSGKVAEAYQLKGMPNAFLVDRKGKVNYIHLGFKKKDKKHLDETIAKLVKQK